MKTFITRGFALLLTAGLFVWLLQGQHWQGVGERIAQVPPWQIAVAVAAFALTYMLRAGRVYDEFRHLGHVGYFGVLRLTLAHNAAINILPFRSGEAAFPLLLNRWFGVPTARAVAALLWLRLQDAFVVLALAALVWPALPAWLRGLWIAAVALAAWLIPAWARRHPEALPEGGRLAKLMGKLRAALAESTRGSGRSWLWTIANWSVKLAAQAWLLAALLNASLATGIAGAMGVELAAILPIQGVAGFGTYEAGGAALMRPHGVALADGLQAALALHLFVIACALAAGGLALALLPGPKNPEAPESTT
ncbi:lysylphosphatidylglycerol synthase transmembrane domain-containing protein [Uliginosibacterium sp. H1]|uniref:lysylphosphatidylglycerol synthase transmembrane domain-containing protein n=1 Tax=Uliginosibacterium sp. H1 TaxID=3114757 RepID=UPI002E175850|nr:lysylphosphatidylglycerol synthase transmembrane domain-containing protein [Uliginosibacterium sp. H1]